MLVRQRRLVVRPNCRRLLEQLQTTLWDRKRHGWERTAKDHGDLIDCLVYLARNLRWNRDPSPPKSSAWEQGVARARGQVGASGLQLLGARRGR